MGGDTNGMNGAPLLGLILSLTSLIYVHIYLPRYIENLSDWGSIFSDQKASSLGFESKSII